MGAYSLCVWARFLKNLAPMKIQKWQPILCVSEPDFLKIWLLWKFKNAYFSILRSQIRKKKWETTFFFEFWNLELFCAWKLGDFIKKSGSFENSKMGAYFLCVWPRFIKNLAPIEIQKWEHILCVSELDFLKVWPLADAS